MRGLGVHGWGLRVCGVGRAGAKNAVQVGRAGDAGFGAHGWRLGVCGVGRGLGRGAGCGVGRGGADQWQLVPVPGGLVVAGPGRLWLQAVGMSCCCCTGGRACAVVVVMVAAACATTMMRVYRPGLGSSGRSGEGWQGREP